MPPPECSSVISRAVSWHFFFQVTYLLTSVAVVFAVVTILGYTLYVWSVTYLASLAPVSHFFLPETKFWSSDSCCKPIAKYTAVYPLSIWLAERKWGDTRSFHTKLFLCNSLSKRQDQSSWNNWSLEVGNTIFFFQQQLARNCSNDKCWNLHILFKPLNSWHLLQLIVIPVRSP